MTPLVSFKSLSSGGSDRGEEVTVSGLGGGLSSSPVESEVLSWGSVLEVWILVCVFRPGSRGFAGDSAGELRTLSQNCS